MKLAVCSILERVRTGHTLHDDKLLARLGGESKQRKSLTIVDSFIWGLSKISTKNLFSP